MRKVILPGLAMIAVTYALARLSYGLFLPNISNTLGMSEGEAGLGSSIAFIAYALALLLSALLIKHFGYRKVNLFAGFTAVFGLLGMASAPSILYLNISLFIAGLGSGLASPALSQMVQNTLSKEKLDQGNTWINSGTSFGIILTGPIVILLTDHWRLAYLLFAVIAALVLIWNHFSLPPDEKKESVSDNNIKYLSAIKTAKYLLVASLLIGGSSSIYWTFSRSFITSSYGLGINESVIFWMIIGLAGILGGVSGNFIQKLGLSLSYRLLVFLLATSIFLLTIPSAVAIYLSAFLFGSTYVFLTGLCIVWATRIFPVLPALGVSLSFFALGIGQSLGSYLAGISIEMTSYPFSFNIFAAFCLVALFVTTKKKSTS
ncbi:MFS transporter [Cytobacillus sp. FSL K6-0129]|uniref:MFS transporter n=1 Tax=Cytobacillus sp. FSL K6-0129 TaxID=2921421 RepID=UPI0030FB979F